MRRDPDAVVGPFEPPPVTFRDASDRPIDVEVLVDSGAVDDLVAMYETFDAADRAQGLPPLGEGPIREWLATLREGPDAHNLVARHDDRAVGHATLVPDGDGGHELAIFVHQEYQSAGIGTTLLETLLGQGARHGVDVVWLTVERWNRPAVALYEKIGFDRVGRENFALEMAARVASPARRVDDGGRSRSDREDGL